MKLVLNNAVVKCCLAIITAQASLATDAETHYDLIEAASFWNHLEQVIGDIELIV